MIFSTKKGQETHSVKPGSSLLKWPEKTKKYINRKRYVFKLGAVALLTEFRVKEKAKTSLALIVNIAGTGLVIWYCIHRRNFVSYGLISALFIYYFNLVVDKIKQPYKKED